MLNRRVEDSADTVVGKLKDVLIKPEAGAYAPLLFLVVKSPRSKNNVFIPYEYVENIGEEAIDLKNIINTIAQPDPPEDAVWLLRDVLDQQIVDVAGARVVRVNDLRISQFEERMCVLGIDISFKGLLRRLGLVNLDWFNILKVNLIDWRKAQLVKGSVKLNTLSKDLAKLHPADLANIVEDLAFKQGSRLVRSLDADTAAKVLEEIEPDMQKALIQGLAKEEAVRIISRMSPDEIANLLNLLPTDERAQFMAQFQQVTLKKVERLLGYPEDTAGGLMGADFVTAENMWSVKRAIEEVQRMSPLMRSILYVYVIDATGKFKGALSLRRLMTAESKDVLLGDLAKRYSARATLRVTDPITRVVKIMTKYNLYFCAVLDEDDKLAGVISIDDVMRHLAPNA